MAIDLHKNFHLWFYLKSYFRYLMPQSVFQSRLDSTIENYLTRHPDEVDYIYDRVNYYNQLSSHKELTARTVLLRNFKKKKKVKGIQNRSTYFFDTYEYTRYFPDDYTIACLFGDVRHVPFSPCIVKSRPLDPRPFQSDLENSVLLNLDKVRHFILLHDAIPYESKVDKLIGYMYVDQPHRARFLKRHYGNPLCELGQINKTEETKEEWLRDKITIAEHLKYKFILSLEGNDVASNLKWIMSSNSIPVMPEPVFETWFMEGRLIPGYHYICINRDYNDLEEKLRHYIDHPDEAKAIVEHNHEYVAQFRNKEREDVISLLVLKKFFEMTVQ